MPAQVGVCWAPGPTPGPIVEQRPAETEGMRFDLSVLVWEEHSHLAFPQDSGRRQRQLISTGNCSTRSPPNSWAAQRQPPQPDE